MPAHGVCGLLKMKSLDPYTKALLILSVPYAVVWALCTVLWRMWPDTPVVFFAVFVLAFPLGLAWANWIRNTWRSPSENAKIQSAAAATWVYLLWWQLTAVMTVWGGLHEWRTSIAYYGTGGLFLIGMCWLIWGLGRASRRIELRRMEAGTQAGKKSWNPLDPQAWYYGRGSQKLKQSLFGFSTYALLFWLLGVLLSQVHG